ncbi:hypothetical protein BC831DRAFT_415838 [Entophlyctis helioformis]|nr:hypothetical protein BC831DRAFT_415838 [Entophlyctis helioformis]
MSGMFGVRAAAASLVRQTASFSRCRSAGCKALSAPAGRTGSRSLHVAIVGAGPAGFYTASKLLKQPDVKVDLFEQLPVPYGLVRYGVAPDHPEVKNVIQKFEGVAENPAMRFVGNVCIGTDIPLSVLRSAYDAVILTYGSTSERRLGIPGESQATANVFSSRAFVGWYNGHPAHANLPVDLSSSDTAVVIGQGNVALDVARLLVTPIDVLAKTDIARHALDVLAASRIRHVRVVGRRGPAHIAFTSKEFREMLAVDDGRLGFKLDPVWLKNQLEPYQLLLKSDRPRKRLLDLMAKGAVAGADGGGSGDGSGVRAAKSWALDFLLSPTRVVVDPSEPTRATAVEFETNTLVGDVGWDQRAKGTGDKVTVDCGLVVSSVGYQNQPLGDELALDPETRSHVPNERGRVESPTPLYVAGWLKTGPRGVIASTMYDAYETADTVLEDHAAQAIPVKGTDPLPALKERLASMCIRTTDFADWKTLDAVEQQRGAASGKEREKLVSVSEMLDLCTRDQ